MPKALLFFSKRKESSLRSLFNTKWFLFMFQVITAFGRLGTMFGCDKYKIQPDLVSIAKVSESIIN